MPEGPECKVISEQLDKLLKNSVLRDIEIVNLPNEPVNHRFSVEIKNKLISYLKSKDKIIRIYKVNCKGKFIYFTLIVYDKNENNLKVNEILYIGNGLGMTGHWRKDEGKFTVLKLVYTPISDYKKIQKKEMDDRLNYLYFDDIRHFSKFYLFDKNSLSEKLNNLGPDVLSPNFTFMKFNKFISNSSIQNKIIANELINQKILSGIGNYLRVDILYNAKIDPNTKINALDENQLKILFESIKFISHKAYEMNGTTIKTYKDINMNPGNYTTLIYGKNTDPLGNEVKKIKLLCRTMYYVPKIQK